MEVTEQEILLIDAAIHSDVLGLHLEGKWHPINYKGTSAVRSITYKDVTFIEQNPNKTYPKSTQLKHHALMARQGHKITWGMKEKPRQWIYVLDHKITEPPI